MNVVVVGLGYVGCVSAACLTARGHTVAGIDVNLAKVQQINDGIAPMIEPGLAELVAAGRSSGRLSATTDVTAVASADVVLVCVGTPSRSNGQVDTSHLSQVALEIGEALKTRMANSTCVVCVRSTVPPGFVATTFVDALQRASGLQEGTDFHVCVNPEFLREGSAIRDFEEPPFTIVGERRPGGGSAVAALYEGLPGPSLRMSMEGAVLVKYASNAFHALKVAFANEIGALSRSMGTDAGQIMEAFCLDTRLNISRAYLRPGYAFGGSCLPKDLRALAYESRSLDTQLPLLETILESNRRHFQRALDLIFRTPGRRVAVIGLSFKPATDDLRESPLVALVEQLIGKGYEVAIYDADVRLSRLIGANRDYIERTIPHISRLLHETIASAVQDSEIIVIGKPMEEMGELIALKPSGAVVVDLCPYDGHAAVVSDDVIRIV